MNILTAEELRNMEIKKDLSVIEGEEYNDNDPFIRPKNKSKKVATPSQLANLAKGRNSLKAKREEEGRLMQNMLNYNSAEEVIEKKSQLLGRKLTLRERRDIQRVFEGTGLGVKKEENKEIKTTTKKMPRAKIDKQKVEELKNCASPAQQKQIEKMEQMEEINPEELEEKEFKRFLKMMDKFDTMVTKMEEKKRKEQEEAERKEREMEEKYYAKFLARQQQQSQSKQPARTQSKPPQQNTPFNVPVQQPPVNENPYGYTEKEMEFSKYF